MTGAASKHFQAGKSDEIGILKRASANSDKEKPYSRHVELYYDDFTYTGPSSHVHNCLVTEPLAHSLLDFQDALPKRAIPLWLCKRFAKHILRGLDYLHEECGVVYAGARPSPVRRLKVLTWHCSFRTA